MHKLLRFSILNLLVVGLALGVSLSGAGTTHAMPNAMCGPFKQVGQSHRCRPRIRVVKSPTSEAYDSTLNGIATLSANNLWAVGGISSTNGGQTLIEHWNGSRWSVVPSPSPGSASNDLFAIEAVSANDIWAVGFFTNTTDGPSLTLIEHWNGSCWSVVPSPRFGLYDNSLYGIEAVSASDIWAVGSFKNTIDGIFLTLVEHWNGSRWSVVPSPSPGADGNGLTGIEAVSASDIWAVGDSYDIMNGGRMIIEHWNGSCWSVVPSPSPGGPLGGLFGIEAVSANDIWVVGDSDETNGVQTFIEHWNGSRWRVVPSPSPGSYDNFLSEIEAVSANDIWAVGFFINGGDPEQTLIEHWNGSCWSVVPSPSPGSASNGLYGIEAVSANDIWVVGDSLNGPGPDQTLIVNIAG